MVSRLLLLLRCPHPRPLPPTSRTSRTHRHPFGQTGKLASTMFHRTCQKKNGWSSTSNSDCCRCHHRRQHLSKPQSSPLLIQVLRASRHLPLPSRQKSSMKLLQSRFHQFNYASRMLPERASSLPEVQIVVLLLLKAHHQVPLPPSRNHHLQLEQP